MKRTGETWTGMRLAVVGLLLAGVVALVTHALDTRGDGEPVVGAWSGLSPSASSLSPSPEPTPSSASRAEGYSPPDEWTEPERWALLPQGQWTDKHGSVVGFPHTVEGGVAMAVAANTTVMERGTSIFDEQMRLYDSYGAPEDRDPVVVEHVKSVTEKPDRRFEKETGAPAGGPLPAGAYMRSHVIGYKIIEAKSDEISLWVLARATQKNGELAKESGSYTRTLIGVQWQNGDWKLGPEATARALSGTRAQEKPPIVAPGDSAFNAAGWTALREAS
ncbi:hypothetical protein OHR86_20770 [Streptomyces sp. NBC_00441]|uniref:hypothetical protein n=1 Tax=Streptomyces sp. NBC_00441 TaxID=2975742 RepID=UPI002E2A39DD|nr:hypothetical protein [Streptomyces sp. NBC_00441]